MKPPAVDCDSDHCHLAWLIRDNRHLINLLYDAKCSSGKEFEELDPNNFNDCPVIYLISL